MSLFQRLGGEAGIAALVDELSDRVNRDPLIGPYFANADEEQLRRHRTMYIAALLGGPDQYHGRSLRDVHERFHLADAHMDAFLAVLDATLAGSTVSERDQRQIMRALQRLRATVVSTSLPTGPIPTAG